jgi:preprotein translocase subunit SecF
MADAPASHADARSGLSRLLSGETDIDFIGRSRTWLLVSMVLVVVSLASLAVRGLNFSIDFTGGTAFVVENATGEFTVPEIRDRLEQLGIADAAIQIVDDGSGALVSTPAIEEVAGTQQRDVTAALAELTGAEETDVAVSAIGPRWGRQITRQALIGLGVFLALVVLYITLRFELRMAVAALVTLLHDIVVTVGLYALFGFNVSPASVIALLTILGYSLYDTVVVFDRITEDTARLRTRSSTSYGEMANAALNGVLIRSLSTSITSLLPVVALLVVGANLLGATTLSDLALALFIGMGVGTYSSIFVAAPFLVWLKEKEPRLAERKQRRVTRADSSGG